VWDAIAQPPVRSSPPHPATLIKRHARLLLRVSKNELKARYAGATFGVAWAFLTPLLVLATNATVYSLVLKVRVPGLTGLDYVLFIFSGLVPFMMLSESLTAGLSSIIGSKSVWTNTVFPVDLAPVKAVLLSQGNMFVGNLLIITVTLLTGKLAPTVILLPVLWGLQIIALIGLNWILSLANILIRDIQNVIGVLLMVMMVGTPIVYTAEMVPHSLSWVVALNPFAHFVAAYQSVLVLGRWPDPVNLLVATVFSVTLFVLGGMLFARAKPVLLDYV